MFSKLRRIIGYRKVVIVFLAYKDGRPCGSGNVSCEIKRFIDLDRTIREFTEEILEIEDIDNITIVNVINNKTLKRDHAQEDKYK